MASRRDLDLTKPAKADIKHFRATIIEDNCVIILSIAGPDEVFGRHRRAAPQPAGLDVL